MEEAMIRIRISQHDAHYAGGLVNGSKMLDLFGDVATELLIRLDGDEGLFAGYDNIEFKAPVYAGDFIEARGKITKIGNTSRRMEFMAVKVITLEENSNIPSSAKVLSDPLVVCKASGICVVPKESQRGGQVG